MYVHIRLEVLIK